MKANSEPVEGPLGLAHRQGRVPGVKEYAAIHAYQEGSFQTTRTIQHLHQQSEDGGKARRSFTKATYTKVLTASEHHLNARKQKVEIEDAEGSFRRSPDNSAAGSGVHQARELMAQRKLLVSAGLVFEADKVQEQAEKAHAVSARRQDDIEQQLYQQRLWALELQQKKQKLNLHEEQAGARGLAEVRLREELEVLTAAQGGEHGALVERLTRAAALEDVELPFALQKLRYRPSEKLSQARTVASLLTARLLTARLLTTCLPPVCAYRSVASSQVSACSRQLREALKRLEQGFVDRPRDQVLFDTATKIKRQLRELQEVTMNTVTSHYSLLWTHALL